MSVLFSELHFPKHLGDVSGQCDTVSPESEEDFVEIPFRDNTLEVLALASNTTQSLVDVLLDFTTPCMGR